MLAATLWYGLSCSGRSAPIRARFFITRCVLPIIGSTPAAPRWLGGEARLTP
jgi:hypothetical protein